MNDFKYAFRQLAKSPGFTAIAVVSLGIGIGLNTTIYSVLYAAFLRPIPFEQPEEIVRLNWPRMSYAQFEQFGRETKSLGGLIAVGSGGATLRDENGVEILGAEIVSTNFFEVLGVRAALGRAFTPRDGDLASVPRVVLSHSLWQRRFGGDRGIIGRTITLSDRAVTVVGVVPPGFGGTRRIPPADLWFPADIWGDYRHRTGPAFGLIGRLRPGFEANQARAEFDILVPRIMPENKPVRPGARPVVMFTEAESTGDHGGRLASFILPVASLVLLVACMNVSGLLLARNEERKREFAVRLALGAAPRHLIRQFMAENVLVALLGAGLALLFAAWAIQLVPALVPATMFKVLPEMRFDHRALLFAISLAAVATLLIGLWPAWRVSRGDLNLVLNGNDAPLGHALRWWSGRNLVVAGQLMVAVVFLGLATLLVRGFFSGLTQDLGFTPKDLLLVYIAPELQGVSGRSTQGYFEQLAGRVRALPEVKAASLAQHVPFALNGGGFSVAVRVPGDAEAPREGRAIRTNVVAPDFFSLLGIGLSRGRSFTADDDRAGARVVVISENMARQFWPGADPVGQEIFLPGRASQPYRIVGVARDITDRRIGAAPEPFLYLSFFQENNRSATLLVEPRGNPSAALEAVRREMRAIDRRVLPLGLETMNGLLRFALFPQWIGTWLAGVLGGLAFALALTGLCGVVAYTAARRTREIGIRLALGAAPADAMRMVLKHGLLVALPGLLIGLLLAAVGGKLMRGLLYGVSPLDPLMLAGVSVLALGAVLFASYFPARRAARVDPMIALRTE